MSNNILAFISDEELTGFAEKVIAKVKRKVIATDKNIYKNVIDPFSAAFDSARQDIIIEEWLEQEKVRQVQKTLQNALGEFHQQVLGSVAGWHDAGKGGSYDVGNETTRVIAEIKTKHNTMNANSSKSVYENLANHLKYSHKGYTAYLVEIVPKSGEPYDKPWSPNLSSFTLRDDIRRIDGKSFYEMATGDPGALKKLYMALPELLSPILDTDELKMAKTDLYPTLFDKVYS